MLRAGRASSGTARVMRLASSATTGNRLYNYPNLKNVQKMVRLLYGPKTCGAVVARRSYKTRQILMTAHLAMRMPWVRTPPGLVSIFALFCSCRRESSFFLSSDCEALGIPECVGKVPLVPSCSLLVNEINDDTKCRKVQKMDGASFTRNFLKYLISISGSLVHTSDPGEHPN